MPDSPRQTITQTLDAATEGDPNASSRLFPLVYDELRRMAAGQMAQLPPGNTLQPTALVHEAYIRLVGDEDRNWNSRGHFFTAAAEAMRQILVDQVRRKKAYKRGGNRKRVDIEDVEIGAESRVVDLIALDQALTRLQEEHPRKGQIVLLRYFAGLTREETALALETSVRTIDREWRYIVARLFRDLGGGDGTAAGR